MTNQDLVKTGSMIAQEVLTALHLPGSVALSRSVETALKKRFDEGVRALIDELGNAGANGVTFGQDDHDEFVQVLLRFYDSMHRGTEIRNLRLLAKLLVGLKEDGSFHFDEFGKMAGAIEGLTLDELRLLTKFHEYFGEHSEHYESWRTLCENRGFSDDQRNSELLARCGALMRTGFVIYLAGFDGGIFIPSPSLDRLVKLAKTLGV